MKRFVLQDFSGQKGNNRLSGEEQDRRSFTAASERLPSKGGKREQSHW